MRGRRLLTSAAVASLLATTTVLGPRATAISPTTTLDKAATSISDAATSSAAPRCHGPEHIRLGQIAWRNATPGTSQGILLSDARGRFVADTRPWWPEGWLPDFSRNGGRIALLHDLPDNRQRLSVASMDDWIPHAAVPEADHAAYPSWGNRGRALAWTNSTPQSRVWKRSATGKPVIVEESGAGPYYLDWSRRGQFVYANSELFPDHNVTRMALWVMDSDGSNRKQVAASPDTDYRHTKWSPDGTKILYLADPARPLGHGPTRLMVMNADGSNKKVLSKAMAAVWRPDGCRILYTHPQAGLFTIRPDGTDRRRFRPVSPQISARWWPLAWQRYGGHAKADIAITKPGWPRDNLRVRFRSVPHAMAAMFTIRLFRLSDDGRRLVASERGRFATGGLNAVTWDAPPRGRCQVRLHFHGDWRHLPATDIRALPCNRR